MMKVEMNTSNLTKEVEAVGLRMLEIVKGRLAAQAIGRALGGGLRPLLKAVKRGVPKKKRKGKRRKHIEPRTGLLKKSFIVKHGVTKKGVPYALVGPSRSVKEDVKRGRKTIKKWPVKYAHLVEYGFLARARKAGIRRRQSSKLGQKAKKVQRIIDLAGFKLSQAAARGASRVAVALAPVGNILAGGVDRILGSWYDVSKKRRKKFFKKTGAMAGAVKGFVGRIAKRTFAGRTLVKPTNFISNATRSTTGAVADATIKKLEFEMQKLLKSVEGKARRKAEKAATS